MDERMTREALRYLGFGTQRADESTLGMIRECFEELSRTAKERIVYRVFGLDVKEEGLIKIGNIEIESKSLSKNLKGCEKVILLGATLGVEVDMLMKRYSCMDMARAVVLQACAAAFLERYLDGCQREISGEMAEEGYYLRPRFSPGYGDFSILHQREILAATDAAKRIGLAMTEGSMLTPTKSVTALIGLSREQADCPAEGCEGCEKTDCAYRRENVQQAGQEEPAHMDNLQQAGQEEPARRNVREAPDVRLQVRQ